MNECSPLFGGKHPITKVLDPSLYAPCETCGMLTHPGLKVAHECPEPLPYEMAASLATFYVQSGIPCHPRLYAQIKMGLEGPSAPLPPVDWSEVVRRGLAAAPRL